MKKHYIFFLLFAAAAVHVSAQVGTIGPNPLIVPNVITSKAKFPSVMVIDTLVPPSFGGTLKCDTAFRCYDFDYALPIDSGYVFGNSKYNGTEAAQKYYWTGSISEVIVVYGKKAGTTGATTAKIYSVDATTKKPLNALATSSVVLTGSIIANYYTSYKFATPIAVNGAFAIACVFPPNGPDTVGVASTKVYCSTTDTLSFINFPSLGGWKTCPFAYSVPYDPAANLDLVMYPVIDGPTGVEDLPAGNGLTLLGANPNPATSNTVIGYELDAPSSVSVEVFDLSGRIILQTKENAGAGKGFANVDVRDLSAGNYYYTIQTDRSRVTSRFSVVK